MTSLSEVSQDGPEVDGSDLLNWAIEAYYEDMTRSVSGRRLSRGSALDIVHDLYIKLAAQPGVLRDKRSIRAFLCRAAINLGIDRYRREQFEARLFASMEGEAKLIEAQTASPDHRLDVQSRISLLREAIAELPARRRFVFILHRLHQNSPDEIAEKLNISRNMVDRHLRRALAHCLDRLLEME